jgi:hypothetical protein
MEYLNTLYSRLIYHAFDTDMTEKIIRYDRSSTVPIQTIPIWGSRYRGAWWGETPAGIQYWLIELCQMQILTKREYTKICNELSAYNNGKGIEHLREYYPEGALEAHRKRLTQLLKVMVWAGRDMWKWDRAHALIDALPDPYLLHKHHMGPMYTEEFNAQKFV